MAHILGDRLSTEHCFFRPRNGGLEINIEEEIVIHTKSLLIFIGSDLIDDGTRGRVGI